MIRRMLAATVVAVALTSGLAAPAAAVGHPNMRIPTAPTARPSHVSFCVTTTWRAQHTGHRKTRPGETCILTRDMWLPSSWRVLARHGSYLLVRRPA